MVDRYDKETRSKIMSSIKSKDTKPEIYVRKKLFMSGYRYSLHKKDLPGTPDIFLNKYNTAIQVRGCFWHNHGCPIGHIPSSNLRFWKSKLLNNKKRDGINDRKIKKMKIKLFVLWECRLEKDLKKVLRYLLLNKF